MLLSLCYRTELSGEIHLGFPPLHPRLKVCPTFRKVEEREENSSTHTQDGRHNCRPIGDYETGFVVSGWPGMPRGGAA